MASWKGAPWPGMLDTLPERLRLEIYEDFLEIERMSFCLWYSDDAQRLEKGAIKRFPDVYSDDPDGSKYVLSYFPFRAEEYISAASDYYGRNFDSAAIEHIYGYRPLSQELIFRVNAACKVPLHAFARTGYPIEDY